VNDEGIVPGTSVVERYKLSITLSVKLEETEICVANSSMQGHCFLWPFTPVIYYKCTVTIYHFILLQL